MNEKFQRPQVPIPHRDEVTARQVATLLQAAATLYPVLLNEDLRDSTSKNGGAMEAAEATFIRVCNRLDIIMDDADRWSMNAQRNLETMLGELYTQNINLLKTQQHATQLLASPHTIHKPSLLKLEDGTWLAILGNVNNLNNAICAAGNNPSEALMAWDAVFTGVMQQQTFEVKDDPAPDPQPKPRKKRNGKK